MPFKRKRFIFFCIALRHMNSVYNKLAQEVAPTDPPGSVPGLPRFRTFVTTGTFLGGPCRVQTGSQSPAGCKDVVRMYFGNIFCAVWMGFL